MSFEQPQFPPPPAVASTANIQRFLDEQRKLQQDIASFDIEISCISLPNSDEEHEGYAYRTTARTICLVIFTFLFAIISAAIYFGQLSHGSYLSPIVAATLLPLSYIIGSSTKTSQNSNSITAIGYISIACATASFAAIALAGENNLSFILNKTASVLGHVPTGSESLDGLNFFCALHWMTSLLFFHHYGETESGEALSANAKKYKALKRLRSQRLTAQKRLICLSMD